MFTDKVYIFGVQIPTYYLVFGLLLFLFLQLIFSKKDTRLTPEEENVRGLSVFSKPSFFRLPFALVTVIAGTIFIPALIDQGLATGWALILYVALFYGYFKIMTAGGIAKADEQWLMEDKIERQKNVIVAQQKQQAREEQDRRAAELRQLEEENARYAQIGIPDANPADVTETARRLAEELRRS